MPQVGQLVTVCGCPVFGQYLKAERSALQSGQTVRGSAGLGLGPSFSPSSITVRKRSYDESAGALHGGAAREEAALRAASRSSAVFLLSRLLNLIS